MTPAGFPSHEVHQNELPSVIVFVKYAFPRQIADTFFTNSTRLRFACQH